jgi:Uma2 family endonuclease
MSQPAVKALDLPFELVYDDGIPLENALHRHQMDLLIDVIQRDMASRGRKDYYTGGNNFVYYSPEQAHDVAAGRSYFRGPDWFFVDGAEPREGRKAWVRWEEGGRLPDVILELLSPSTERIDRNDKMKLYSRVFRTREYYLYDFETTKLEGFRLAGDLYQPMRPGADGRLRSEVLGLDLGLWKGCVREETADWVRLFHPDGSLIPSSAERAAEEHERAEQERRRADGERQRADAERQYAEDERRLREAAEREARDSQAEVVRLQALLRELGDPRA